MAYYSCKVNWCQPKEGTDEMQKMSKSFLTYAESCTEAEARMVEWMPSNYQDAVVVDVKKTSIGEIKIKGDSETFWLMKIMDDLDGTAEKAKPYLIIYNAEHLEDAVKICAGEWSSEIENVTRFKTIVDDDLISDKPIKKKLVKVMPQATEDDDEEENEEENEEEA